jgi:membrane-bound ClpP family serine protease
MNLLLAFIFAFVGLILIHLEFFLPGAIMGILGALSIIASLVLFFFTQPTALFLLLFAASLFILLYLDIRLALWLVRRTGRKGTVFLESDQTGYRSFSYQEKFLGKEGKVISDLRPSGHIEIEGAYLQAVSKTGYIESGLPVQVVGKEGARLIVKQIKKEES